LVLNELKPLPQRHVRGIDDDKGTPIWSKGGEPVARSGLILGERGIDGGTGAANEKETDKNPL
jgi:hypothetical protein